MDLKLLTKLRLLAQTALYNSVGMCGELSTVPINPAC